jgi:hypothetical protein
MIILFLNILLVLLHTVNTEASENPEKPHIRVNQLGYLPGESKIAIAFSHAAIKEKILLISDDGKTFVTALKPKRLKSDGWGTFNYYYEIDFTHIEIPGNYFLQGQKSDSKSQTFSISSNAYQNQTETLLGFMRQQRCGFNPFLDVVCHQKDGRSMFGPMPDSTFVDVSGGWHDAGDQLKYLITGSYATAHMLLAYELYPDKFALWVNHPRIIFPMY